ncbi:MAG: hypothetical protein H0V60_10140 [Actinobacteria bacterium]|nr:hypothetical protein [Actinomycetota bacterium]
MGAAAAFDRELDGRTLKLEVRDGRIVDTAISRVWNVFRRAVSGPLEGQQLIRL